MKRLSDEERDRKRLERNEQKRERRKRLREIEDAIGPEGDSGGNGTIGHQLETLVARIAEQVAPQADLDEEAVRRIIDEHQPPRQTITIKLDEVAREIEGKTHRQFEPLLKLCRAKNRNGSRHNILLIGPAGCGKSYAVQQVAEALEARYGFISLSSGVSEAHLIGRYIPTGEGGRFEYQEATFVDFYRNGGIFCLDELDAADENVLLVINQALANGHLRLPDGSSVQRHPDFVAIGCANTFGNGADRQYVGRNQLDASTLDRFVACRIQFDYDADFEQQAAREDLCSWAQGLRQKVQSTQIRRVVSTRFILDASDLMDSGACTFDEVKHSLFLDWTDSELSAVEEVRS